MDIQRKLYFEMANASAVIMPNFTPRRWFECDLFRVTKASFFYEYEIKVSISDFRADSKKSGYCYETKQYRNKHEMLSAGHKDGPNRFFYVVPAPLAEKVGEGLPAFAGLLVMGHGPRVIKNAPLLHKNKIRRSVINQSIRSAYGRFWDLWIRCPDYARLQKINELERELEEWRASK